MSPSADANEHNRLRLTIAITDRNSRCALANLSVLATQVLKSDKLLKVATLPVFNRYYHY